MTEAEWLRGSDADRMLKFLEGKASDRKLRLFCVACYRTIWHLLADERSRAAVSAAEDYADGRISSAELMTFHIAAGRAARERPIIHDVWAAVKIAFNAARASAQNTRSAWFHIGVRSGVIPGMERSAEFFRHILGNPFRPHPGLPHVPSDVGNLAEVVYQQDKSVLGPLHDALLDAGLNELAEHFTDPAEWHPKGCWVVDLLTRRA